MSRALNSVGRFLVFTLVGLLSGLGSVAQAQTQTWKPMAVEFGSFSVSGTQVVRMGADTRWVERTASGSVQCTIGFFGGDPASGARKRCEQLVDSSAAPTWTYLATENGSFNVAGIRTVRWGVNSSWVYKTVSGAGQCTNAFFGSDPLPYNTKHCDMLEPATLLGATVLSGASPSYSGYTLRLTAVVTGANPSGTVTFKDGSTTLGSAPLANGLALLNTAFTTGTHSLTAAYGGDSANAAVTSSVFTQTTVAPPATWTSVASENGSFNVAGTQLVRYGAGNNWFLATLSGNWICSNDWFQIDPIGGVVKGCSVVQGGGGSTGTLPAPVISPAPVVNYEYDAKGNPTKRVQAPGVTGFGFATTNTYDVLDRQKDTTDARLGKTQFAYNGRTDLTQVTDPRNLVTQTPRNGLGDATQLVSSDTGTAAMTYDAAGNLKTRTDSRGVLATYSYDALNRPLSVLFTQSGQANWTYTWAYDETGTGFSNGVGRLTSTTYPAGFNQYSYNPQGRLLSDVQNTYSASGANTAQLTFAVSYGYDTAGNITSITYPSGRRVVVTYTGGQPSAIGLAKDSGSAPTPLLSQITWQPFGAASGWQWQTGSTTQAYTRVFDTSGRLVRYTLGGFVRDVAYDAADRITSYTHLDATTGTATTAATALNQSFGYDELGRLTTVSANSSSWTIGYDANGNRTGVTLNGAQSVYTTAATSNRLASVTSPARTLGYDDAGHTTSDTGGAFTATYKLPGYLGTLTKAGVTTTYSVNSANQRVRKFSSSGANSTVIFVYNQSGQLLGEYSNTGAAIREYVWLGSTPVAIFTPDPANTANAPLVYYVHTDHLDTPRVVTDTAGQLRWRWLAEPFGNTAPETNPQGLGAFVQNLRFPGQYADQESGLFYNYFRDYDASLGRYVESDPIGLGGGINTYSYVGGNPLSYTDSQGLSPKPDWWNKAFASPDTSRCVTAECAAGLLPAPQDNRTQTQVDYGQCKLVCNIVATPPVFACNIVLGGGIPGTLAGTAGKLSVCSWVCKP